jgi:integrase/recombinase XerD
MATQTQAGEKMAFNSLNRTNQKLAKNPELSEHNKQVLEDFFSACRSGGAGDAILRDYSSRFNKLAEHIDFSLDNPDKKDLREIYAKFNTDEVRKNNGGKYSDYSKDKFDSTISKFYNGFIKSEGKGYNEELDGPELVEDLEMNIDLSSEFDPSEVPEPEEVKQVAKNAKNRRDQAIILTLWATGARVGEIFETEYNDKVLTWSNITFEDNKLWIELDGKTGERDVPIKTGMPILKQLWEENDADLETPVFAESRRTFRCPSCRSEVNLASSNTNPEYKKYSCKDCEWQGGHDQVEKEFEPLGDNAVRRIIERCAERAGLEDEFNLNPHDFGRKSRAMYKARIGFTDHQMRAFFGWSETSDAPKHYLKCVKEDLEKALAEEFGEEVEYGNGYDEEALRPVECVSCGTVNSSVDDLCRNCDSPLTEQGEELTRDRNMQGLKKNVAQIAKERDLDPEEFEDMLEGKSILELIELMQT